jgi:hypothetical protein
MGASPHAPCYPTVSTRLPWQQLVCASMPDNLCTIPGSWWILCIVACRMAGAYKKLQSWGIVLPALLRSSLHPTSMLCLT